MFAHAPRRLRVCANVPANTPIERAVLAEAGAHLRPGDLALIRARSGERESLETAGFWLNAPWMTAEGAIWLRERGIKAVGFDFSQDHCIRFFLTGEKRSPRPAATSRATTLCWSRCASS